MVKVDSSIDCTFVGNLRFQNQVSSCDDAIILASSKWNVLPVNVMCSKICDSGQCHFAALWCCFRRFPNFLSEFAIVMAITVLTRNIVDAGRRALFRQGVIWADQLSSGFRSWAVRDLHPKWREQLCCSFGDLTDKRQHLPANGFNSCCCRPSLSNCTQLEIRRVKISFANAA